MTAWQALLPPALVGLERHAGAWPPLGAWPSDVAVLLAQATEGTSRATGLLRAAAVLAVVQSAAEFGRPFAASLPAAAGEETLPAAQPEPLQAWLLHEGPARTQHELLAVLGSRGQRLPDAWLPTALELGRRSTALRAPVAAVLGTRGVWLAAQRDDWRWAGGSDTRDDEARWSDGTLEQRVDMLRRQRAQAPAAARERLAAALPELPANERAELLATLALGLADADEPLLEALLADRSREVRQAAGTLLLRLPGSAFVGRAIARVEPLLRQERSFLARRWVIEPPALIDWPDPPRPKHETLGDRAWWLYQAARQVPLAWWCRHLDLKPAELLDWAAEGDWTEALHRAWRDVLFAAPDPAWCSAFVRSWPRGAGRDQRAEMLSLLPLAEREDHWQRTLDIDGLSDALLAQLGPGCPPPQHLSAPLSHALLAALPNRLAARPLAQDGPLRDALPQLAGLLHPEALPELQALQSRYQRDDDPPSVANLLHLVHRIAAARVTLYPRKP
jgi:hypothetical protein